MDQCKPLVCGPGGAAVLPRVAALLAEREGSAVLVRVLRRGDCADVQVTPRRWGGRGLLGCHMRPRD
jgi:26S proteasome non-ATPase regulatory subunit 9